VKTVVVALVKMFVLHHQDCSRSNKFPVNTSHHHMKKMLYHLPLEGVMTQKMASLDVRENLTNLSECPRSQVKVKEKVMVMVRLRLRRKPKLMEMQVKMRV